MYGKEKCRILRQIRRTIAEANEIPFDSPDCPFADDCSGTCPLCEDELRYLESELQRRRAEGQEIRLVELCADLHLDLGPMPPSPEDLRNDRDQILGMMSY